MGREWKHRERSGSETLHWHNPGDYEYDEESFENSDYEIVEEDD